MKQSSSSVVWATKKKSQSEHNTALKLKDYIYDNTFATHPCVSYATQMGLAVKGKSYLDPIF